MGELLLIQRACPAMPSCTKDRPYLLMTATDGIGDYVSVDVEWVSGDGVAPDEIRMSVTARQSGGSAVLLGAVFDAASGALLRGGNSLSMARPIPDAIERDALMADLSMMLSSCLRSGQDAERAAA